MGWAVDGGQMDSGQWAVGSGRTTLLGPSPSRVELAEPVNADTVAYYVLRTRRTSYHRTLVLPPSVPRSTPWPVPRTSPEENRDTHARANRESGRWTPDAGLGLGIFPENMEKLGL